jgi:hypothetical protein
MNALKHGLTAQQVTVFDETAEAFQAFHDEFVVALRPNGGLELNLAEWVILCAWRLRRVYRIETGLFCKTQNSWSSGAAATTNEIEIVFLRLASNDDELSKLTRYETSIERSLQRALKALERRQAQRQGTLPLSPLPGRRVYKIESDGPGAGVKEAYHERDQHQRICETTGEDSPLSHTT